LLKELENVPSERHDDNTSDHEQEASVPKIGIGKWHSQQLLLPASTKIPKAI
jgi:hypothetical protein